MHSADQVFPIRLLIVSEDVEEAEAAVSHLRNSGLAVRPARAANIPAMTEHLAAHPFDVVLASSPSKGFTDADLKAMGEFFAAQKPSNPAAAGQGAK